MTRYTFDRKFAAHYGMSRVVIVPDQVADDQKGFADRSFPAIVVGPVSLAGRKVRVRIDAEATGLWTSGTGDLRVRCSVGATR